MKKQERVLQGKKSIGKEKKKVEFMLRNLEMLSAKRKTSLNRNYMQQYKGKANGYTPLLLRDTLSTKDYGYTERSVKTSMGERAPVNLAWNPKKAREMTSSGPAASNSSTVVPT